MKLNKKKILCGIAFFYFIQFNTTIFAQEIIEFSSIGGNELTGEINYGSDLSPLKVTQLENGNCKLENNDVITIHMHGKKEGYESAHEFTCNEQLKDQFNQSYSALSDVHFNGTIVMEMYEKWYQLRPVEGKLKIRVHYGENIANSYWNPDLNEMIFGDGDNHLLAMTMLDVTSHEVSHGITDKYSQLDYTGQSGALSESFSDIAGEAAEFYLHGKSDFLFAVGANPQIKAMRYFEDPTKDGVSIAHISKYRKTFDPLDCYFCEISGGGNSCRSSCGTKIHHASGIYNKVFYELANSNGWNIKKAFDIFVIANTKYWKQDTNFKQAAEGLKSAAVELGYDQTALIKALSVVGL